MWIKVINAHYTHECFYNLLTENSDQRNVDDTAGGNTSIQVFQLSSCNICQEVGQPHHRPLLWQNDGAYKWDQFMQTKNFNWLECTYSHLLQGPHLVWWWSDSLQGWFQNPPKLSESENKNSIHTEKLLPKDRRFTEQCMYNINMHWYGCVYCKLNSQLDLWGRRCSWVHQKIHHWCPETVEWTEAGVAPCPWYTPRCAPSDTNTHLKCSVNT